MKNQKFLFALLLVLVLGSCQKDEITVFLKESGTVSVKVVDENDQPVRGNQVFITTNPNPQYNVTFSPISGMTDENGIFNSESLLQNDYYCVTMITQGKIVYEDNQLLQIISGENKTITLSPLKNAGKATIQLVNQYQEPISRSDLNIALVSSGISYFNSIKELESEADFTGKPNSNGQLKFEKIPAHRIYNVVLYNKITNDIESPNASLLLKRDEDKTVNVVTYQYNID